MHELKKDRLSEQLRQLVKYALEDSTVKDNSDKSSFISKDELSEKTRRRENFFNFSSNKKIFSECIENHLLNYDDSRFERDEFVKIISSVASRRFYGKSLTKVIFNRRFEYFFGASRKRRISHQISNDQLSREFREALKQILKDCLDNFPSSEDVPVINEKRLQIKNMVPGWDNEWIYFTQDKTKLADCIENHLTDSNRQHPYKRDEFSNASAHYTARRFYAKSILQKMFSKKFANFFYEL